MTYCLDQLTVALTLAQGDRDSMLLWIAPAPDTVLPTDARGMPFPSSRLCWLHAYRRVTGTSYNDKLAADMQLELFVKYLGREDVVREIFKLTGDMNTACEGCRVNHFWHAPKRKEVGHG